MSNRTLSPTTKTASQGENNSSASWPVSGSPEETDQPGDSLSAVPCAVPESSGRNQKKRPWSSPGRTSGGGAGGRWAQRPQWSKSPYTMTPKASRPITPRSPRPNHEVTNSRSWDWRPKSAGSRIQKLPAERKTPDQRDEDDKRWDQTVASYLAQSTSVYALVNQRDELNAQVRNLSEVNFRLQSENEQAGREVADRLTRNYEATFAEKQRMMSQVESKLLLAEAEVNAANTRVQDADTSNSELRRNIEDLRDLNGRYVQTEKFMQGQVQDLKQRTAQLEQDLKENLKLQKDADAQLKASKDDHVSLERQLAAAVQQHHKEATAERQRWDDQEAGLRRRFQSEIADLQKELDARQRQLQESFQQAAADRNWNQEQMASASARYSTDVGDLRAEVQAEKLASHKLTADLADAQFQLAQSTQKHSKDVGDIREEVHAEKLASQKMAANWNNARSEIHELKQEIHEQQQEIEGLEMDFAEEQKQHAHVHQEQSQLRNYLQLMQDRMAHEEEQCRKAKLEAKNQAQRARELEHAVQCLQAQKAQDLQDRASQDFAGSSRNSGLGMAAADAGPGDEESGSRSSPIWGPGSTIRPIYQKNKVSKERAEALVAEAQKASARPQVEQDAHSSEVQEQRFAQTVNEQQVQGDGDPEEPANPEEPEPQTPAEQPVVSQPVQRVPKPVKKVERNGCVFWQVELKKTHEKDRYGIVQKNASKEWTLDNEDPPEHLIVERILIPGLLYDWNQEHPDAEVIPTDRILAVNKLTTVAEMHEAQRTSHIKMTICRFPEVFELTLKKDGRKFGFTFERPDDQAPNPGIRITSVMQEGAVPESNRMMIESLNWHLVILPEMYIIAINDVQGNAVMLATELRTCEIARLRIKRPEELAEEPQPSPLVNGAVDDQQPGILKPCELSGQENDQETSAPGNSDQQQSPQQEQQQEQMSYRPKPPDFW
eukprot:gnl/MRDRNA2_/MRDRNA2_107842_c0_seq1.p1 gnl/MRDRNA2_/MRDRNA2_107842_c0~~gnl/MRDRNA2_/MRDRNA2_107842_c0_seq1.p1  ORF type:complete len:945 (+),score=259.56 gnl/MRDRNA2_/MRDRNA2_107842_c0_seq1:149-2983(+)